MIETDEMDFSGTLWPVHLKPQEDELLSSWLARLALAHGQTVATFTSWVWPGRILVARDVDLWNDPGMFETLSIKTGTPAVRVFAATMASYEGWLFDKPRKCHLPWALPRYLNIRPHRPFGLQFCPWCLASDKEPYFRRQWRLALMVLCPQHRALLLDRCQSCGMAVCYERQTAKEPVTRWLLTQCYRCRTDLRKFATPRYRTPVDSAELEFTVFLQTALRRGWVELPQIEVIYSHLFFTGLHQIMRRLTYGRMAQPLKAALSRSYAIDLPIAYLRDKTVIFERLNILQRRALLQAVNRLLQNWPTSFIEFCQANSLASHFLVGDQKKDLPFWYLRVVREHLNKGAHKVSDEEIVSIINYVRNGGDQPATEELRPFISPGVCTRARAAGLIKRKEYLGLCPHCHATKRQFKSGLSSHGTQQFRCGKCRRVYQHDYQTGRTRPRLSSPSFQHSKQDSRVASVES
jgi:TniQ